LCTNAQNIFKKNQKMMKKTILGIVMIAGIISFSTSCKKDGEPAKTYPMQVRMTDAAGPYDAVYIDVQSVEVNTDDHGSDNGWVTLHARPGIYDLTRLTNGVDTLLADGTTSVGNISQIRFILGDNNSVVVGGKSYPMKTPSAQESGLKLQVHFTMTAGVNYVVLVDFDASRSIVAKGNGGYSLKPVIRAVTLVASGSLKGFVVPAKAYPAIYAISGTDSIGTYSDVFGHFMFKGILPGTYKLAFVPVAPYQVKVVGNVTVTSSNLTDVGEVDLP
jgi:hypothetical protein